ncbi:MAG: DUF4347 domain-containing protein, partial [Lentisphaeria bacterium]|nr:DUF4347 domain-containing protein [Lentisphaeria bacterium]
MYFFLLKFLGTLSGNCDLLVEKIAYSNRCNRRKAGRLMTALGLAEKGFYIAPRLAPLIKGDDGQLYRRGIGSPSLNQEKPKPKKGFVQKIKNKFKNKRIRHEEATWRGLEQLETRVLLSASNGSDVLQDSPSTVIDVPLQTQEASEDAGSDSILETVEALSINSLAIIDWDVQDPQTIINGLPIGTTHVILDSDRDGVQQIAEILANYSDLDAVHIFSHGESGTIYLGNTTLSIENHFLYDSELEIWGNALSGDGDILFYGCDVAGTEAGVNFLGELAALTGADVAASDDITGKDGDWGLEVESGDIDTNEIVIDAYDFSFPVRIDAYDFSFPDPQDDSASITELIDDSISTNTVVGDVTSNDNDFNADDYILFHLKNSATTETLVGTYGTLRIFVLDGTFDYTLNDANATVNDLDTGETLADAFDYHLRENLSQTRDWFCYFYWCGPTQKTATITITIKGANDSPVAVDDGTSITELADSTGTNSVDGSDILANDSDPEGDTFSLTSDTGGTTTLTGMYGDIEIKHSDGTYKYFLDNSIAAVNAIGTTSTPLFDIFTYKITDGNGTGTANINITIKGANDSPVASDDATTTITELVDSTIPNSVNGGASIFDND